MKRGSGKLKRSPLKRGESQLKRSEMKRSDGGLRRTEMKRSSPPPGKKAPTPRSKKPKRQSDADRRDRAEFDVGKGLARRRDGNRCRTDLLPPEAGDCEFGVHVHHRQPAGRGRRRDHTVNNLLCVCLSHHEWIHSNPQNPTVKRLGLLISTHYSGPIPEPGVEAWDENGLLLDDESS